MPYTAVAASFLVGGWESRKTWGYFFILYLPIMTTVFTSPVKPRKWIKYSKFHMAKLKYWVVTVGMKVKTVERVGWQEGKSSWRTKAVPNTGSGMGLFRVEAPSVLEAQELNADQHAKREGCCSHSECTPASLCHFMRRKSSCHPDIPGWFFQEGRQSWVQ